LHPTKPFMKTKKKKEGGDFDWQAQRKFEAATAWQEQLDQSPHSKGVIDLYSGDPYAVALNSKGFLYMRVLNRLARIGHSSALLHLVRYACELAETIEEIAESHPNWLFSLAEARANWPVMLCRHESTNKLVSGYLDKIHLGEKCEINADGKRVAKFSLRTPINRFVWKKLKGLPFSIVLLSDVPAVAAIDLKALPKLTKATAKTWADKALMPYFTVIFEDFSKVPEFRTILSRPGVRTRGQQRREIRKDVIRALQSLAPTGVT
jgi:hypothetical protein